MAKAIERLSALKVKNEKRQGRHADGGNLYMVVSPSGGKSWSFMYRWNGRQRESGLGSVDALSLKEARERARQGRAMLKQGVDPIEHWRDAKRAQRPVLTFAEAAEAHFQKKFSEWKSTKSGRGEQSVLYRHAGPLMKLPVDKIDTAAVVAILKPVWTSKPDTGTRLRQRIEAVLSVGYTLLSLDKANPARWKGHLDHLLPKTKTGSRHFASMPYAEVPGFVAELRQRGDLYARPLEFVILTGVRAMEGLGARWEEIDEAAKLWTIPKERMKKGDRPHRVPLSEPALAILRQMRAARPEDTLVFRGDYAPLTSRGFERLLKRMGRPVTTHGFRSSFRTWISEQTPTPFAVAEAALAHLTGDATSRSYERTDHLEARKPLMALWAASLDGGRGEVLPFQKIESK
jgi:integrase